MLMCTLCIYIYIYIYKHVHIMSKATGEAAGGRPLRGQPARP